MKINLAFLTLLFFTCLTVKSQEKKENPFSFKWDNGFKLESLDKNFNLQFGGRIMVDHAFFSQDAGLDDAFGQLLTKNGTEIRRARIFMGGTVYNNVGFKLDLSYEGGVVGFKDMYVGLKNIPVIGNVRIGNVKEPFRLEMLTSSKYITFMERSLLSDFSPTRNNGILLFNDFSKKRVSAQAGLFRNAGENANDLSANDGYVFTSRLTGLAIDNKEKKQLLHIGLGYSHRVPETEEYRVSSRPEAHLSGKKYLNTGIIEEVNSVNMVNFEIAFVKGPLLLQAEYLLTDVNTTSSNSEITYKFSSFYGQAGYFLTGEHKKYKSSYSGFNSVKPTNNFGGNKKGVGAWEVAIRYSNSDLNSEDVFGGEQTNITLGLNWYLNPVTRVVFNHVWGDVKNFGNMTAFQFRFQIDF